MAALTPLAQPGNANQQYADLTRSLWYSWMNEIGKPQEDKLIQYATDPGVVSDAMQTASQDTLAGFDRGAANNQRRLEGLGLSLTPEEQAAADRSTNLSRSLADVGSQNRARDQTLARQQAIIGNPVPTIGALR